MSLLFWTWIACVLSSVNFLMKQRISLKQKIFFLLILGHKVLLPYLSKFLNLLIFGGARRSKYFAWIYFRGRSKELCFAWINFRGKSKNGENHRILCKRKFGRFVFWTQWIEKLHIIDKVGVQH